MSRPGAVSLRSALRQRLLTDPLQLARNRVVDLAQRTRLDRRDLVHHLGPRLASERLSTAQELVEHDAQAEEVRSAIDPVPFTAGLLGAHVVGRPGQLGPLAVVLILEREPEIGDPGLARRTDQDIRGLDVSMHQAARMCVVQRLCHHGDQLDRLSERRPALFEPCRQVAAVDKP